jgi:8-oxo-dGTP pyrophosphatase MutT (NUDIX family)
MRARIRKMVAGIAPLDGQEAGEKARVLAWIDSGAPLCRVAKPAAPPMHLVSYFLLADAGHVLLVDHVNAGLWLPTGGHVEPGEDPAETVRRECREELGQEAIFADPAPLFVTVTATVGRTAGHVDVSLWFLLRGDRRRRLDFDRGEFHAVRWFPRLAVPWQRSAPDLPRFLHKVMPLA